MDERYLHGTVPVERAPLRFAFIEGGARANPNTDYIYEITDDLTLVARYVVPVRQYGRYKGMLDPDAITVQSVAVQYTLAGEPIHDPECIQRFLSGEWTELQQYLDWRHEDFKKSNLFKRGGWPDEPK